MTRKTPKMTSKDVHAYLGRTNEGDEKHIQTVPSGPKSQIETQPTRHSIVFASEGQTSLSDWLWGGNPPFSKGMFK